MGRRPLAPSLKVHVFDRIIRAVREPPRQERSLPITKGGRRGVFPPYGSWSIFSVKGSRRRLSGVTVKKKAPPGAKARRYWGIREVQANGRRQEG